MQTSRPRTPPEEGLLQEAVDAHNPIKNLRFYHLDPVAQVLMLLDMDRLATQGMVDVVLD
jgi:hypothetical protein